MTFLFPEQLTNVANGQLVVNVSRNAAEWLRPWFDPPPTPLPQWWANYLDKRRGEAYVRALDDVATFMEKITS